MCVCVFSCVYDLFVCEVTHMRVMRVCVCVYVCVCVTSHNITLLQCVVVCCSVLQCVAVCCSVLMNYITK